MGWYTNRVGELDFEEIAPETVFLPPPPARLSVRPSVRLSLWQTPTQPSGNPHGAEEGEGGLHEALRRSKLGLLLAQLPDRHVSLGEARRSRELGRGSGRPGEMR